MKDFSLLFLTDQYLQLNRHYHTLEHITHMFLIAKRLDIALTEAQVLAIWWHDAFYEAGNPNNELNSVNLMKRMLESSDAVHQAAQMIMDTKTHIPTSNESAIVTDLDMCILAESRNVYDVYANDVRLEFSHIPESEYLIGRKRFLEGLLVKPIFYTLKFEVFEEVAQQNIRRELAFL